MTTPRTDIMASGNSDPSADEYADLLTFTRQLETELNIALSKSPQTLYLVTAGEYSDYHVCGVFTTAKSAVEAKRLYASTNEIEQIEVDAVPDHPAGMFAFSVTMDRNGNVKQIEKDGSWEWGVTPWRPSYEEDSVVFTVWARHKPHAIKVANEKRIGLLLSEQWTTSRAVWLERTKASSPL